MTYKCFLDMRNPLVVDFEGKSWGESIYGSTDESIDSRELSDHERAVVDVLSGKRG